MKSARWWRAHAHGVATRKLPARVYSSRLMTTKLPKENGSGHGCFHRARSLFGWHSGRGPRGVGKISGLFEESTAKLIYRGDSERIWTLNAISRPVRVRLDRGRICARQRHQ